MSAAESKPKFSPQQLLALEARVDSLTLQLQSLNAALGDALADHEIEPKLKAVNDEVAALRRQWRQLLDLPPPRQ